jgi:hypothetical protein
MYVLKAKSKICAPHSFQTDEPRNTKIDMGHLGLDMISSAKFDYDRITGTGAPKSPLHVDFSFLFYSSDFFDFFDRATDRTPEPISLVDSSSNVFSREEVLIEGT